jgi:hypothetical protein
MTWFCVECEKIVPDSEVKDPFKSGRLSHVYVTEENAYKNQFPGQIGYCPVQHTVFLWLSSRAN